MGEKRRVRLGEYEIIERIGAGGMGQVFKATQVSLDRVVALKLLPKSMVKDRALVERLYREAKAAARIIHPNVVQIYSVGEEHGVPYFAMEYVEGEDLERILAKGDRVTLEEAIDITAGVAMALSAAGELDLVHRDIKPANIMISKAGIVKVTDFGLAKPVQSKAMNITQAGYILGTPTYMSPEQAEGGEIDSRSDIYSLGVVFYELLTGLPPFVADSPATLIYKHVHEEPKPPSQVSGAVPSELDHCLLKCLAKKPEDRYRIPSDFLEDLLATRKGLGVAASNTIVFDPSQAEKLLVGRPATSDTTIMSRIGGVVEEGSPLSVLTVVLAAATIGILLVSGGFYLFDKYGKDLFGISTMAVKPTIDPLTEVDFSFLTEALPQGSTCLLISKTGRTPLPFSKLKLEKGSYSVKVERQAYLPLVVTFTVSQNQVKPPLKAEDFVLEATPELVATYDEAKQLYEQGDLDGALTALSKVDALDPNYKHTVQLTASINEMITAEVRQREERWERATGFYRKELYEDAIKLLKDIEPDNTRFTEAQNIIQLAENKLAKLAELRTACVEALKTGDVSTVEESLAALEEVAGNRPTEASFLKEHKDFAVEFKEHLAFLEQKDIFDLDRKRRLTAILKISPQYKLAKEELEKVERRLGTRSHAEGLMATAENLFAKGEFAKCRSVVAQVKETWSAGLPGLNELDEKALLCIIREKLCTTVACWQKLLAGEHPKTSPFADKDPVATETALFLAESPYPLKKISLSLKDFHKTEKDIQGDVELIMVFTSTPAGDFTMKGTLKTTFIPAEAGYIVKVVTLGDGGEAEAENEEGEPGDLVRGTVKSIDKTLVKVAVEHPEKIPLGDTVLFYGEGEVLIFPYSNKVALQRPELIAKGRVLKRLDDGVLVDAGVEVETIELGSVAVYDPLSPIKETPPRVVSLEASPNAANTSLPVEVKAEIANPDGLPIAFRWEATGGKLQANLTPQPKVVWYPPADKGDFTITAKLISKLEESSTATVEVEGLGPTVELPKSYETEGMLTVGGGIFQDIRDIAFDENNNTYILDGGTRKIKVLSSGTRRDKGLAGLPRGDFRKIVVRKGKVYLLDTGSAQIIRCAATLGKDLTSETSIGGKGNVSGSLSSPVDFDLLLDGRVVVIDKTSSSIEAFTSDGRFLFSLGSPGKSTGNLDKPVAITVDAAGDYHVLDAGRSTILTYREARLICETPLPEREIPALDITYDAFRQRLIVLSENGDAYARNGDEWEKLSLGGTELGKVTMPAAVAVDNVGILHVADRRGKAIELFDEANFLGRLGGEILARIDKFTIAEDGSMYLLDARNAIVGKISAQGALVGRFGGRGKGADFEKPIDIETSGKDTLYVLDTGRRQVLAYSSAGKLLRTIGKSGKRMTEELLRPVDMFARGDKVYVLQDTGHHCVHVYSAENGSLLQAFPGNNDARLRTVQALAVDETGRVNVACARQPLHIFTTEGGLLATGKTRLPLTTAAVASPDGTIALLDGPRSMLYVFRPDEEEKLISVNLASLVKASRDVAADAFGGIWVLGNYGRLVRLVPVW